VNDSELGRALRRWRERLGPADVGLPVGGRRRAPGLRREELAGLAGISVDYLTRLEQGRATAPSAQVVEALARALRLADAERELLFRLAGLAAPGRGVVPTRVSASIQRLLDTSQLRGHERNGVWRNVVGTGSRAVQTPDEHEEQVAGLVADLRATAARYPDDARLRRLVADLRAASPEFVRRWEAPARAVPDEPSRHKVILHPTVGPIAVDCDTLVVAADDLRIMVYTAEPGTVDADRLELAIVLGTQALADAETAHT
jgi:transcriptional regulator with XRE-family HTH domain